MFCFIYNKILFFLVLNNSVFKFIIILEQYVSGISVYKSRWWSRCRHLCSKSGLIQLVNLIWLREGSLNGMVKLGMNVNAGRITSAIE